MRKLSYMIMLIGLGLAYSSSPVFATDQSAAVQLCSKNPSCASMKMPGGMNFKVGKNEVWCPDRGPCVCVFCTGVPARRMGGPMGFVFKRFMVPESIASHGTGGGNIGQPSPTAPPSGYPDGPINIH